MTVILVFLIAAFLIALGVLLIQFLTKHTLKSALASLISCLVVMAGGLSTPEMQGVAKLDLTFGSILTVHSDSVTVTTAAPSGSWLAAFQTISGLVLGGLILVYLSDRSRPTNPSSV